MQMNLACRRSRFKIMPFKYIYYNGVVFRLFILPEYSCNFICLLYDNSLSLSTVSVSFSLLQTVKCGKKKGNFCVCSQNLCIYSISNNIYFVYFLQIIIIKQIPFVMPEDHQMRRNISFSPGELCMICDHCDLC